jgi:hypothetical protein
MDKLYTHLQGVPTAEIWSEGLTPYEVKPPMVKLTLDPHEGLTPERGRYSTFYNMYFINREWCQDSANLDKLAKQFAAFVLVKMDRAMASFTENVYGAELIAWLAANVPDYFLLLPVTTVRKGKLKFAGVHVPRHSTNRSDRTGEPTGAFLLRRAALEEVAAYAYGAWVSGLYSALKHTVVTSFTDRVKECQQQVFTWLELTPMGPGMKAHTTDTNMQEVAHA